MKDYIQVMRDDYSKRRNDNVHKIDTMVEENYIYGEVISNLEKALQQCSKETTIINETKNFIDELKKNINVDKDNNIDISYVTCDYVIQRLKDIIK